MAIAVLAGLGAFSVWQDQRLAYTEAVAQAEERAALLLERLESDLLPTLRRPGLSGDPRSLGGGAPRNRPLESMPVRSAGTAASHTDDRLAVKLADLEAPRIWSEGIHLEDGERAVIRPRQIPRYTTPVGYPRPPEPEPLALDRLDAEQRRLWQKARRPAAGSDPSEALQAYEAFLDSSPPPRFAALGLAAMVEHRAEHDRLEEAAEALGRLAAYSDQVTESGIPIFPLAASRLVGRIWNHPDATFPSVPEPLTTPIPAPESRSGSTRRRDSFKERRHEWIDMVCRSALQSPSLITPQILDRMSELEQEATSTDNGASDLMVKRWREIWSIDETTRACYRAHADRLRGGRNGPRAFWTNWRSRQWIILEIPDDSSGEAEVSLPGPQRLLVYPKSRLESAADQVLAEAVGSLPEFADVHLSFQGVPLVTSEREEDEVLATASSSLEIGRGEVGSLDLQLVLTDPGLLYARHRQRALWLGGMIAVSVLVALFGLRTTRSAIDRQVELNRLKTNLISSISHEIRSPVAAIRLLSERLEDGPPDPSKQHSEYLHLIRQESNRLSALIENMLDYSRIEQGRKEYRFTSTDLVRLMETTVEQLKPLAEEKGVALRYQISGAPLEIVADGHAIQQALINLIDNAIKHAPAESTVRVTLQFPDSRQEHSTNDSRSAAVLLCVEDDGEGIPSEEHQRIFERFYRRGSELRRETPGAGIGLNLVKHIVEANGGEVRVESEVGQGSRFVMALPAGSEDSPSGPDDETGPSVNGRSNEG